ncbi:uncharacterized protein LOC117155850 [Bombus vancouverensis nearcticus]|uniref:uncharacterized protein LOC117155850 n=1 Tax=Bombus vancouverensis nearcticus TaxID=2705178 RepID=UPI001438C16E|nr:uncharacterized protein LOC117155850 [Bombus vancouverensis nearcticus]
MIRSIAAVFILALAAQATFALIAYPRETVILKFTDEDIIETNSDSYPEQRDIPTYLGTLSAGEHVSGERNYISALEHSNPYDNLVLVLLVKLQANGRINFVSAENINGSEAVVCETANTLGSSESIIHVRIAPKSTARLRVLIGTH